MALQLAFEDTGAGIPVVILHGLFGSSTNWRSVARALAPRYRVICVDLRNHGNSPWADSMDYLEMADDVRALIEDFDGAIVPGSVRPIERRDATSGDEE